MPRASRRQREHEQRFEMRSAIALHQFTLETENRAENTKYYYRLVLDRYCAYLTEAGLIEGPDRATLGHLTAAHARDFLLWLRGEHGSTNPVSGRAYERGPKTMLEHVRALKAFSAFCVRDGLLDTDPLKALRPPKVPIKVVETFSPEQLRLLLAVVEQHPLRDRNRTMIYFLLATGVRASELCGLKVTDLDVKLKRAKIHGKGSKERMVYFDPATAKLLVRYLADRTFPSPYVFVNRFHRPLTRFALAGLLKDFGREAGIADRVRCSPHTFRHTFSVQFLEAHPGALFHLQELLGHTDLEMVRRYARVARGKENLEGPSVIESLGLDKPRGRR